VPGGQDGDHPTQWSVDGKSLYVCHAAGTGIDVFRLEVATGRRELWKHIVVNDAAGIVTVPLVIPTRDGRAYAYTYVRVLSKLFHATGLR